MVVGKVMAAKVEPDIWLRNTAESLKFNFTLDGTTRRMKRLAFSNFDRLDVPAKASATPSRMLDFEDRQPHGRASQRRDEHRNTMDQWLAAWPRPSWWDEETMPPGWAISEDLFENLYEFV